jgi:hypothetical protein
MTPELKELYQMQNCLARFSDLTIHKADTDNLCHIAVIGGTLGWMIARLEAVEEIKRMNKNVVDIRPILRTLKEQRG